MNQHQFPQSDRSPALVLTSLITLFTSSSSLLSICYAIIRATSATSEQQIYVNTLTPVDYGLTLLVSLAFLIGSIKLFLLRRTSLYFFVGGLVATLAKMLWDSFAKSWFTGLVSPSLAEQGPPWIFWGVFVGALLGICWYSWKLTKEGVLS
jgi:hypothetical protein